MHKMAVDRTSDARGRIESALSRIDAALAHIQPSQHSGLATAELAARHESLRSETRRALADLDALIGSDG